MAESEAAGDGMDARMAKLLVRQEAKLLAMMEASGIEMPTESGATALALAGDRAGTTPAGMGDAPPVLAPAAKPGGLAPARDPAAELGEGEALWEIQARVAQLLADGGSVSSAAREVGVHRGTIHRWFSQRGFREACERARFRTRKLARMQFASLASTAIDA